MKYSVCYQCKDRTYNCHDNCERYAKEIFENRIMKEKIFQEKLGEHLAKPCKKGK